LTLLHPGSRVPLAGGGSGGAVPQVCTRVHPKVPVEQVSQPSVRRSHDDDRDAGKIGKPRLLVSRKAGKPGQNGGSHAIRTPYLINVTRAHDPRSAQSLVKTRVSFPFLSTLVSSSSLSQRVRTVEGTSDTSTLTTGSTDLGKALMSHALSQNVESRVVVCAFYCPGSRTGQARRLEALP
jgi:hypothetical protein